MKKLMATLLTLTSCIGIWAAFNTTALAEGPEQPYYYSEAWENTNTGQQWINVKHIDPQYNYTYVVLIKRGDTWYKLDEKQYYAMYGDYNDKYNLWHSWLGTRVFDPEEGALYLEAVNYSKSTDGQWGYWSHRNYAGLVTYNHFIKNFTTGEITVFAQSNGYARAFWLADNRLVYNKFGAEEKENVIYIYDPAQNTTAKLFNGSMWGGYFTSLNTVLFVKNEPTRQYHAYNFTTGETTALGYDYEEINKKYIYEENTDNIVKIAMPLVLSKELIADLPLYEVNQKPVYEHMVTINGTDYPVNRVITYKGKQYIAIRALLEPLQITMATEITADPAHRFVFKANEQTLVIGNDEYNDAYLNLSQTLLFTPETLAKLGITVTNIKKFE